MHGLFLSFLLTTAGQAAPNAFQDAFHAYVNLRRAEEEKRTLPERTDLDEGGRAERARALNGLLTQARVDFHSLAGQPDEALPAWERQTLASLERKPGHPAAAPSLDQFREGFPDARDFSPLEWQAVGEWFGENSEREFLRATFAPASLPEKAAARKPLLWIHDSFAALLSQHETPADAAALQALRKAGYTVDEITLSPYTHLEDQTNELKLALAQRLDGGAYTLVTSGAASALLLKTFDLNPSLLARGEIQGWVNLDGELFGRELAPSRSPASVAGPDRQIEETRRELSVLRSDRLERQARLSARFPITNLVSGGEKFRPARFRESLVPEGKTYFFRPGQGAAALKAAL